MRSKAVIISAVASNQGKTIFSSALLHYFRKSVRAFKTGPDFIDPQFHESITNTPSVNLDGYMMNSDQLRWTFERYSDKNISVIEGVMGYYDGMEKGCSAYDIGRLLGINTILVIDGSGSYITISALIKGMKTFKKDNTIKGVVLNRLSSQMHYELIKKEIKRNFDDIEVLGWIPKNLESLKSTYLGLSLSEKDKTAALSKEVLKHIDLRKIALVAEISKERFKGYPFNKITKTDKKAAIVKDSCFSFIYHDNVEFLKELFKEVVFVSAENDEEIPHDTDFLFIPGGYVESEEAYSKIKNSDRFKNSLIRFASTKPIYAECAGLLYLSNRVDDKKMSKILDIDFELKNKRVRLGYYHTTKGIKGHAFHYTKAINPPKGEDILYKGKKGEYGSWKKGKVYGTYLHTMFRSNEKVILDLI